jgi:hypothetical protein
MLKTSRYGGGEADNRFPFAVVKKVAAYMTPMLPLFHSFELSIWRGLGL